MFEVDIAALDADTALAAAAELRATADHAKATLLAVAAHYADLHPTPARAVVSGDVLPGTERTVLLGGEGCPQVAEFAAAELGAALGLSTGAASGLIEDALALRHRLPRTWARVRGGEVQAWRARKITQATRSLSRAAAGLVDARVARIAQEVTPYRLDQIVRAAVADADPDQAKAQADEAATDRGVWVSQSDLHGTKTMVIKAAAGDVIRLDATTAQIADCLSRLGDTDTVDARRARAIGWIAQPQAALDLWNTTSQTHASAYPGTDNGSGASVGDGGADQAQAGRPVTTGRAGLGGAVTLYVHLTDQSLATGTGLLRTMATTTGDRPRRDGDGDTGAKQVSEALQPLLVAQLAELIGDHHAGRIVVKPVIDLRDKISADAYEISDRIREHVQLTHPTCTFPWCNRPASPGATGIDLDHIVPFDDTGPPGQTSTDNLGPGCRLHHRLKTHGGWRCQRLPDSAFEWTSPRGRRYRVDHTGTHPLTDTD